jgi:hypothetical protein
MMAREGSPESSSESPLAKKRVIGTTAAKRAELFLRDWVANHDLLTKGYAVKRDMHKGLCYADGTFFSPLLLTGSSPLFVPISL